MRRSSEVWWRGALLLAGLLMTTALPGRAISTTTVSDVVYRADGGIAQGTLLVSWPSFTAADGSTVAAGTTTVAIAPGGRVTLQLTPNEGAQPAGTYYTAVYHLSDGTVQKEYWVVPQLATATIAMMRSKVVPAVVAQPIVSQQSINAMLQSTVANFLPLKGGALTGALNLAGDPQSDLQAATKQYVDAHSGGGAALPTGIVYGQGSTAARASTATDLTGLFHSMGAPSAATTTLLKTVFDEGAAGATLAGTRPATDVTGDVWHFGASAGTTWNFVGGGGIAAPTPSASPTDGPYIDIGQSDFALTISTTQSASNYSMVMLRYTSTKNMIFANLDPVGVQLYSYIDGAVTEIGGSRFTAVPSSVTFTLSGPKITITGAGQPAITATTTFNQTATKIGFTNEGTESSTVTSLLVTHTTITIPSVPCAGVLKSDGTCYTPKVNQVIASDPAGNFTVLEEKETQTDGLGLTTIACDEDQGMGRFDPRCSKYGNGGIFGPSSGQALQELSSSLICYEAATGRHPTVYFPPGLFRIGTAAVPTLIFPAGGNYIGAGGRNGSGGGTVFQATYNNLYALQFNTGQSAVCSDGVSRTANVGGGNYQNFGEHGCGAGGCINVPGDAEEHPNGGPHQGGIFIGDSQGYAHDIAATYNGDTGVNCNGLDSVCDGMWGASNMEWYYFGKNEAGQVYNPATDPDTHCNVVLGSGDGQFSNIETYGFFANSGNAYGKVCGVYWGGGNSQLSRVFSQIDEIGIIRKDGTSGKLSDFRIEACRGECLLENGGNDSISNGHISSPCRDPNAQSLVASQPGNVSTHCDGIDDRAGGNLWSNVSVGNDAFFGTGFATGEIYPFQTSTYVNVTGRFDFPVTYYVGQGAATYRTFAGGQGAPVTGPVPSVANFANGILPSDTAPIAYTGVSGAWIGQEFNVAGGNANVTLQGTNNGGHWHNCNPGEDLNLASPGVLHYVVTGGTIYGNPAELTEQCDVPRNLTIRPVPASSTEACSDADFTFGLGPGATGGFGMYRCHPANSWTFYALTPTLF